MRGGLTGKPHVAVDALRNPLRGRLSPDQAGKMTQAETLPAQIVIGDTAYDARFNADMKTLYRRKIDAGNHPRIAIAAVMRKLIVLANALIRDIRPWTGYRP